MKQRIQFGEAERSRARFIAPQFGTSCICCNAETHGRTRDFDPSTDRVRADVVPMPVCAACDRHAFVQPTTVILQTMVLILAALLGGASIYYMRIRPSDDFLKIMLAISVAVFALDLVWIGRGRRRAERARDDGHHPGLEFSVAYGRTWLDTTNPTLVEDLVARNPSARVLPTPLLWRRANRREAASARVVKSPPRPR